MNATADFLLFSKMLNRTVALIEPHSSTPPPPLSCAELYCSTTFFALRSMSKASPSPPAALSPYTSLYSMTTLLERIGQIPACAVFGPGLPHSAHFPARRRSR